MSDYLTIEEIKKELKKDSKSELLKEPFRSGCKHALELLDRLEPSDAKLRKVREAIRVYDMTTSTKIEILYLIDSHLPPSEPEVDEELEEAKKAWPVGRKFGNVWDKDTHTILEVYRDTDHELRIKADSLNEYGQDWYIVNLYLLPSEPTEAEKFRQEADALIERINNAVDKLGK